MRHYKKGRKLGTDKSHTKAMKFSLVSSLFLNDRIITIESRAKEIRGDVDKIIGWAKRGDLHSRRLAIAALRGDQYLVAEIFEKVEQGMFKERNSGYTRIVKLGPRKGDNAPMVIMELINEGKKKEEPKKEAPKKKADPKKEEKPKTEPKKEAPKKEEKPKEEPKKEEPKKEDKPKEEPKKEEEAPKKEESKKEEEKK
ncbi:MAG: 50S ribosomal protein L17 [Coriobacteriia bacterium]|nr:50S ribosomal protein L17 [Coriobacteriia bacterium]